MIVDRYYYSQLNNTEKVIYKAFYNGVMEHKDVIPIPIKGMLSQQMFDKIYRAITNDNPLIYYLNQTMCSFATDGLGHTAICPQYFYSKEKVQEYNKKIEKTINKLASTLELTKGTEYEKELKIHDWLCQYVSYADDGTDMNNPDKVISTHNIIGVFANHSAQCEGIAKAFKVLLNAVDIKCIVVTGNAKENSKQYPHAWNIVKIDDKSYQVDVTWDIGAGSKTRVAYDYFNVTDELMSISHVPEIKIPICNSVGANYFKINGTYFESRLKLMAYINSQIKNGQDEFYFKVKGKCNFNVLVKDIVKEVAQRSGRACSVNQQINKKTGTCWIRVR